MLASRSSDASSSSSSSSSVRMTGAEKGGEGETPTFDDDAETACRRVLRKLRGREAHAPISTADHCKAVELLNRLKKFVDEEGALSPEALACLICAGIAAQRRSQVDCDGASSDDMAVTRTLIFVVVVCSRANGADGGAADDDGAGDDDVVERWFAASLGEDLAAVQTGACASWWRYVLHTPDAVCNAVVAQTCARGRRLSFEAVARAAELFFALSADALAVQLFDASAGPRVGAMDFVNLSAATFVARANEEEYLDHVVESGESEHGQQVFRDLVLSFKLPRDVVGVRRTCLLSRNANAVATAAHASVLGEAHDAAMRGTKWTWDNDKDETHKACALLAGLAVSMCAYKEDVRQADMFGGRVQLPFLSTRAPEPGVRRTTLVTHSHEWVVYTVDARGAAVVELRAAALDGLKQMVVLLCSGP